VRDIAALYRELDPLRPLEGDEDALYVDWQRELDPGGADVKSRLARAFVRNAAPERPIVRLLTGHKGSGKTTELNRVARRLSRGIDGKRVFVSTLFAQQWLDVDDIQPEDLVLQVVRQLVADLRRADVDVGEQRFTSFLRSVRERVGAVRLETVEVGADPLAFSFALKDFPTARGEFRDVLRGQLPTVFDLVNTELLPAARRQLKQRWGYEDVVLVVDDLDKIPQKVLGDQRVTNHENLFLDNAATLRAIKCSMLVTIPIELAYSPAQGRLRDEYGSQIDTVPLVSIVDREGDAVRDGEDALIEMLGRRARTAFGDEGLTPAQSAGEIFASDELLRRVVRMSGGHVRSLLVLLTEMLDWVDDLPIQPDTVDRYAPRAARNLAKGLFGEDKEMLKLVDRTKQAVEDVRFFNLLRNHYVFAYEAGTEEYWYGLNPLLREIRL
jgi:hypothetical protein